MVSTNWIKATDFIQTVFDITLKNVTTRSEEIVQSGVEVVELHPSGLLLRIPKKVAAFGHLVLLEITRRKTPEKIAKVLPFKLSVTAKITQVDTHDKETLLVTLQFYQFVEKEWALILEECAERQRKTNDLLRKIQE